MAILALPLVMVAVGCGPVIGGPASATPKPPYTLPPPTPSLSPIATVSASGPGRPYVADALMPVLAAAPVGFPRELRTRAVAEALADRMWSYDGQPYRDIFLAGTCEQQRCEFIATGLPRFASTTDVVDTYRLSLDLATGVFSSPGGPPSLKGFPPELTPDLDALTRSLDADKRLKDVSLLGIEWMLPPPSNAFILRYGRGLEEGDPTLYVTLDRGERKILSIEQH